jgi:hypothetical protein
MSEEREINRWHNILGSFADWKKISTDFESLHKQAEDAGFYVEIIDDKCPHCGFSPVVELKEETEEQRRRRVEKTKERRLKKGAPGQMSLFSDRKPSRNR